MNYKAVSKDGGGSADRLEQRWASRIWILVADVAGLTALLAVTASPLLGDWLGILGPASAALALWALRAEKPEPKVVPAIRRRVNDIRIVITPRAHEDEYGYPIAA